MFVDEEASVHVDIRDCNIAPIDSLRISSSLVFLANNKHMSSNHALHRGEGRFVSNVVRVGRDGWHV